MSRVIELTTKSQLKSFTQPAPVLYSRYLEDTMPNDDLCIRSIRTSNFINVIAGLIRAL